MCLAFIAAIQKCLSFPLIHRLHIYLHEIVIPFIRKGGQLTLPHPYKNFIQTTISIYRWGNQKLGKYFFLGHIFSFEDSRLGLEMFCLQRLPSLLISLSLLSWLILPQNIHEEQGFRSSSCGNTLVLKLGGQVVYRCWYVSLPFSYTGGKSGQKWSDWWKVVRENMH